MNSERAKYVLANTVIGGDYRMAFRRACDMPDKRLHADGINEAEDRTIKAIWETMPGWTTYRDALQAIANGARLASK